MDRYDEAEHIRQIILDHLWERVATSRNTREIADSTELDIEAVQRAVRVMCERDEIKREFVKSKAYYTPVASQTYSSQSARTSLDDKRKQRKRPQKKEPWRFVHRVGDNDQPIKNQGGQGAVRRNVTIKSCMA